MFLDWKNQYSENEYTIPNNVYIQFKPYQTTKHFFHSARKINFTIFMEDTKDPEKPKQSWERRMEPQESSFLTSEYTTKLQSSGEYNTGTKIEI